MAPLIELRDVTREYRLGEVTVQALRGIDLDVDAGQVVVLLGPSGSVLVPWALALLPGLLAGTWVAGSLGDAIAADLFTLEVRATPTSYLFAAAGVLAIAFLALVLPLRRVARLDLASVTKTLG